MDKVNIQIQRQVSKPGQAENNQAISTIRPRLHQAFGLISQYACYRCCVCVINRTAAILLDKFPHDRTLISSAVILNTSFLWKIKEERDGN